jgi:predicted transcriptional regulator
VGIRRCDLCGHNAPLLTGRCTEPDANAICGCACPPDRRREPRRRLSTAVASARVLQAVADGHTWGVGISAGTGLQASSAYAALQKLVADGMLERERGRGPHRDRYRLTAAGQLALEAAGQDA